MKNDVKIINEMKVSFPALSVNEGMARATVGAFCAQLNPTIDEIADIKCAVSEAVTNCIVHAYREKAGEIYIKVTLFSGREIRIEIKDKGCGIADLKEAQRPLYTTDRSGERSGMGFTVMQTFTDKMTVRSKIGSGTTVILKKRLSDRDHIRYGL